MGVICNDFNEDGNVDLLVSTGTPDNVVVTLYFYDANKKTFNQAGNKQVSGTYKSQPVVFQQFNEDNDSLRTYFLLQGQDENNPRQVFYFDSGSNSFKGASFNNFMADTKLSTACMSLDQVKFHQISQKKASSFVDLNSDCRPDLVLESTEGNTSYLEFYLSSDNGFCLVSIQPLTADYHMASFFDVDGDGTNDLVLLQSNLVLHVFYNQFTVTQGSLCAKSDTYKSPFTDFNKPQSSKVL